ncbi:MAG: glycosyltransferase involved in cell wall biosynthesis [Lentimonas sp.]|jgi:glycosyltransferase involved in cell wall biosynthesis
MELTVVISYYKALGNLKILLKALGEQTVGGFEVIISEDDNNPITEEYLKSIKNVFNFPIHHLNQEIDNGFRKNAMLNRTILKSNSDWMAFIDGDCVPHNNFVKEYVKNKEDNCFLVGRAVMLSEKAAKDLIKTESLKTLRFSNLVSTKSTKLKEGLYFPYFPLNFKMKGIIGRNWGVKKQDLIAINGFDEDYILAGVGEDVDIEWRLKMLGLKQKSVKNKAIVYHIYHPSNYTEEDVRKNYVILEKKQVIGDMKCPNGINKF